MVKMFEEALKGKSLMFEKIAYTSEPITKIAMGDISPFGNEKYFVVYVGNNGIKFYLSLAEIECLVSNGWFETFDETISTTYAEPTSMLTVSEFNEYLVGKSLMRNMKFLGTINEIQIINAQKYTYNVIIMEHIHYSMKGFELISLIVGLRQEEGYRLRGLVTEDDSAKNAHTTENSFQNGNSQVANTTISNMCSFDTSLDDDYREKLFYVFSKLCLLESEQRILSDDELGEILQEAKNIVDKFFQYEKTIE